MTLHELSLLLYKGGLILVALSSAIFVLLALVNLLVDRSRRGPTPELGDHPFITVQVPSYNDAVAARCLEACLNFSYPNNRYEIMILDDSTDQRTARLLEEFANRHPGFVRYFHRDNRRGYKPGALQAWMSHVRGELVVIFDSDFVPQSDFLQHIAQPFEDSRVAIVQTRQGTFLNGKQNLITRFASYLLSIHHFILMPILHRYNAVFFCGTAGALRKRAIEEVGGWNSTSITEDSDLSVRLLIKGYRSVYLPVDTPSEVPVTIKAFLKQQMRWCFGNVRVFCDHAQHILLKSSLTLAQRILICFMTIASVIAPIVIIMTIAGSVAWLTGDPLRSFGIDDVRDILTKLLLTSGFLILGLAMLYKRDSLGEFPHFLIAAISLGCVLTCALFLAVYKAVFRKDRPLFAQKTSWICTPKSGNEQFKGSG